ncbi:MAG: NAD(P)H-dependent oxidoreductase subunit E [Gammaproteobacteria bacterium]|nr:NAD(P)H-dependent oxidoreductase subunit E [Gammaproteobacteria bacterium]
MQVNSRDTGEVATLLAGESPLRRDRLLEYLHRLHDRFATLRPGHLRALAELMRLAETEVYEVASFYHHFDLAADDASAVPELTVRVCDSLSCALAGGESLATRLATTLGRDVRLQRVPCIGQCDGAPAAVVGTHVVTGADEGRVRAAIAEGCTRATPPGHAIDYATYREQGGYRTLRDLAGGRLSAGTVLERLEAGGLRGLGGAGFPTARKWRIVREQPAPRLVAVNIDEGEPGTFKDRHYLETDPHRFLEGLLIACHVVGAEKVYLYLRDEYAAARALLERELDALRADPPVPLPEIELRRGAGAYICGEESAMLESIEGRRGMPRLRPPYVAEVGLFGRPTLVQNLETLHWVRDALERPQDDFAPEGRRGRRGLRSFSVSGRVARPGVVRAPAGISVRELIDEHCGGMAEGHTLYAYLPGGASGGILPASLADLPLDFDVLQEHGCFIGSAAVIVLSEHDRARDAALNAMRFFVHESCGQCTPCRVGTAKAAALMEAPRWDTPLLEELAQAMADASICGLGQAAPNPLRCVQRFFPDEVDG